MNHRLWFVLATAAPLVVLAGCFGGSSDRPGGDDSGETVAGATSVPPTSAETRMPDASQEPRTPTGSPSPSGGGAIIPGASRDSDSASTPLPATDALSATVIADLARRLGIATSAIAITVREPVEWPDAGLGCPQPGMAYAQVIVSGYRLTLRAGTQDYRYHTGQGVSFVFCVDGKPVR